MTVSLSDNVVTEVDFILNLFFLFGHTLYCTSNFNAPSIILKACLQTAEQLDLEAQLSVIKLSNFRGLDVRWGGMTF